MPNLKQGESSPRDMLVELERAWAEAPGYLTSTALPLGRLVPGLLLLLRRMVDELEGRN